MKTIDIKRLKQLITYDKSGFLLWRRRISPRDGTEHSVKTFNSRFAGKLALNCADKTGRKAGEIFNVPFRAHRVIWALHYGEWPKNVIDHINGDPSDNRIENLRDVSRSVNQKNMRRRCDTKNPHVGVQWRAEAGRYRARITIDGKFKSLGYFLTLDEAITARREAKAKYGFSPDHGERV